MERESRRLRMGMVAIAACITMTGSACDLRGSATPDRTAEAEPQAAKGTDVAMEELTIVHEAITRDASSAGPAPVSGDDLLARSAAQPSQLPPAGGSPDLNGDGVVGASDFFGHLRPCMGSDLAARPDCAEADLNGDGVVGASDFFGSLRPSLGQAVDPGPTPESERISAELLALMTRTDRPDPYEGIALRQDLVAEMNAPTRKHLSSVDLAEHFDTLELLDLQAFELDTTLFDETAGFDGIELGLEDLRAGGVGGLVYQGLQRQSGLITSGPAFDALELYYGVAGDTRSDGGVFTAIDASGDADAFAAYDAGRSGTAGDYQVVVGSGGSGGQQAGPTAGGTIKVDGGEHLVRYAAWDGLPVHASPYFNGGVVDTIDRNQMVWVVDTSPFSSLKYELEDNQDDSLWFALGSYGAMYYLEVFVPESGVTGFVPLYSVVAQPLGFEQDHVRVEVGYGLMAREANKAILDAFEPPGCDDEQVFDTAIATEDLWAVSAEGPFRSCTEEDECGFCSDVLANPEDYLSLKEQCWANPEAFFGDCKDLDSFSWIPYCEDHMIFSGQLYSVPNTDDYRCGEYPVGKTNWWDPDWETYDHNEMVNNRLLHEFDITGWEHHVKMKRLQHQRAFDLSKYNLSQSSVVDLSFGQGVDSKNFWMAIEPSHGAYQPWENGNNRSVRIHACGHLPGGTVFSPHKDYGSFDGVVNGIDDFFYWIKWGTMDWNRADACAIANVTLNGFTPSIDWEEITELRLAGFNLSNFGWSLRAWVLAGAGLAAVISFGLFGPIIGSIVTTTISAALGVAIAGTALVNLTNNDEWVITDVVEFVGKGKVYEMILDELDAMTQQQLSAALANVPSSAAAACGAAFPGGIPPAGSPTRIIYNQCIAMVNSVDVIPFVPHAGNEADGCYDLDHFWTPDGKTTPNVGPWWYRFQGQGWLDGTEHQDVGCRIGFAGRTVLESEMWPTLQCMVAEVNLAFNNDLSTGTLIGNISANCSGPAHQALAAYFGPASDIYDLLEAKHPDDGDITIITGN